MAAEERSIPNRVSVRTDPNDGNAHRFETIMTAKDVLDETSNTKAILGACRHVDSDVASKRLALDYLADRLSPTELAEVADLLATPHVPISLDVSIDSTNDSDEPDIDVRIG
jgi:hypothetical protein